MRKELPPTLTVMDASALLMNISYLPGENDLLQMLSFFTEEAESNLDHAITKEERAIFGSRMLMYQHREALAQSIIAAINAELDSINNGEKSKIEVADDTFGSEKLVTASVYAWADEMGFGIAGWEAPRFWRKASKRRHNTEYLSILDDVIATFCEEGGEHYESGKEPTNAVVSAWITDKYGHLSEKVIGAMGTIIRPGLSKSTKQTK